MLKWKPEDQFVLLAWSELYRQVCFTLFALESKTPDIRK